MNQNVVSFVRKVCHKYSVLIVLLQYDPTDYLAVKEETYLRPKKFGCRAKGKPNGGEPAAGSFPKTAVYRLIMVIS